MAPAALPAAEGITTFFTPSWEHINIAQARPRALDEPVGFRPSSLTPKIDGVDPFARDSVR